MKTVEITIPDCIGEMAEGLETFFGGMVDKLALNSHKSSPRWVDVQFYLLKMQGEILELHGQIIADKFDPNLLKESCDVANFAFLTFLASVYEAEDNKSKLLETFDVGLPSAKA